MMYVAMEGDVDTVQTIKVFLMNGLLRTSVDVRVFTEPDTAMGMSTTVYTVHCVDL